MGLGDRCKESDEGCKDGHDPCPQGIQPLHDTTRRGKKGTIETRFLFGLPMSDDRVLTQDALEGDEGLYDGTEWPLGT